MEKDSAHFDGVQGDCAHTLPVVVFNLIYGTEKSGEAKQGRKIILQQEDSKNAANSKRHHLDRMECSRLIKRWLKGARFRH